MLCFRNLAWVSVKGHKYIKQNALRLHLKQKRKRKELKKPITLPKPILFSLSFDSTMFLFFPNPSQSSLIRFFPPIFSSSATRSVPVTLKPEVIWSLYVLSLDTSTIVFCNTVTLNHTWNPSLFSFLLHFRFTCRFNDKGGCPYPERKKTNQQIFELFKFDLPIFCLQLKPNPRRERLFF